MSYLEAPLEIIVLAISLFSALVLVWGFILCVIRFFSHCMVPGKNNDKNEYLLKAKIELGRYVLLGLEILIVADIIESIIRPTPQDLIRLGAIVTIRTVISFFLNKEIKETSSEISEEVASEKKA